MRWPFRNPVFYNFPPLGMGGLDPNVYLMRDYAPLAERMAAYARYAAIASMEEAPFLSEKLKRDILYNNAARFLRLSEEEIARHHRR